MPIYGMQLILLPEIESSKEGTSATSFVQPSSPTESHRRREHLTESRLIDVFIHPRNEMLDVDLTAPIGIHLHKDCLNFLVG